MNCSEAEDLLSRYVEGDLSPEQRRLVANHLETCAHCRDSHAIYAHLERSLEGLKIELPSPEIVARGVMSRAGSGARRRRFSPAAIWSFPVMANFMIVLAVVILYTYREGAAKCASAIGSGYMHAMEHFSENLPLWISQIFGGEYWILVLTLTLCALLMILTGGYVAIRSVSK